MIAYIEYLGILPSVGIAIVGLFMAMQLIGEFMELVGKVVPEYMKVRKYFTRKRAERNEQAKTLKAVQEQLAEFKDHYSSDNISQRNKWMKWVNDRADVYDESIIELRDGLAGITEALKDNTKLTEEMFVQSSRDRIIDFATKVSNGSLVSKEEFNRIFKVHDDYEDFLEKRNRTNGEVDIAYKVIEEEYEIRIREGNFLENVRGY